MVEDKGIAPRIPVWDRSERNDRTLSSTEFAWDEPANEYRCPQGHALRSDRRQFTQPRQHITRADTVTYRASQHDCTGCPMKQQCRPNTPVRKIDEWPSGCSKSSKAQRRCRPEEARRARAASDR